MTLLSLARSGCGHTYGIRDAFYLLDVRLLVRDQPLRIKVHGPLQPPASPGNGCPPLPTFGSQRLQQCQQPGPLLSKGQKRWLEILSWIICLPDPRSWTNGLERGVVLLENHSNA